MAGGGRAREVSRGEAAKGRCHCFLVGQRLDLTHFFLCRCLRGMVAKCARFSTPGTPLTTSAAISACTAESFRPEPQGPTRGFRGGGGATLDETRREFRRPQVRGSAHLYSSGANRAPLLQGFSVGSGKEQPFARNGVSAWVLGALGKTP